MASVSKKNWSPYLLAILLFACGIAVGALADRYMTMRAVTAKTSETFRHSYVSEMQSKLNLTPTQVARLEVILDDTKARYKAVRDQCRPQMLQVKNEQVDKVKSMLTPEQVPAYEQLVAEHERRAKEQEEHDRQDDARRQAEHRARLHQNAPPQ